MIITCINCDKKFDVASNLIPEKGRLLQCNGCNHKWFFKKESTIKTNAPVKIINPTEEQESVEIDTSPITTGSVEIENYETIKLLDSSVRSDFKKHKNFTKKKNNLNKLNNSVKKKYSFLPLAYVFIISFIAFIIILDTFKDPITKIFPNTEILLYNLYESIKDIVLFIKDLI